MATEKENIINVDGNGIKVINVDPADMPVIITEQISELNRLSQKVDQAMKHAQNAQVSAEKARVASTGMGHKKAAIESLQDATADLATAQVSAAEAQKVIFKYQEQIAKVTQYLFALGVGNIAATQTVIQELELRLKNASEEEINALAQKELKRVVQRLKAQEDIMLQQAELSEKTKTLSKDLSALEEKNQEQDRLIKEGEIKDDEQDRLIAEQAKKDEEHDCLIAEQAKKDEEHDRLLKERAEKDALHDQLLAHQAESLQQYDNKVKELEAEITILKMELAQKSGKMISYISAGVAALAVLLSALQYFL